MIFVPDLVTNATRQDEKVCSLIIIPYQHSHIPSSALFLPSFLPFLLFFLRPKVRGHFFFVAQTSQYHPQFGGFGSLWDYAAAGGRINLGFQEPTLAPGSKYTSLLKEAYQTSNRASQFSNLKFGPWDFKSGLQDPHQVFKTRYLSSHGSLMPISSSNPYLHLVHLLEGIWYWRIIVGFRGKRVGKPVVRQDANKSENPW